MSTHLQAFAHAQPLASVMQSLVSDLAQMSGLRNRPSLNTALVELIARHFGDMVRSVWLLRVVMDGKERRCLSYAQQGIPGVRLERDSSWADWSMLPNLDAFALRRQALDTQLPAYGFTAHNIPDARLDPEAMESARTTATYTTVVPMLLPVGHNALLELGTDQPLDTATSELLHSVLLHYQSLIGLLDYGEKDTLTELLNRKTFDDAFMQATAAQENAMNVKETERRVVVSQGGYWLALLDIDHFKQVNDNFGHLIGDEVLLLLARQMRANFRFHDQLYRFGGEEFVVLMRCITQEDAQSALDRLRKKVEAFDFPQVGRITISIGFTGLSHHDTPAQAFGRSDKALYYAKQHGRNQVCSYQRLVDQGLLQEQTADEMEVDLF